MLYDRNLEDIKLEIDLEKAKLFEIQIPKLEDINQKYNVLNEIRSKFGIDSPQYRTLSEEIERDKQEIKILENQIKALEVKYKAIEKEYNRKKEEHFLHPFTKRQNKLGLKEAKALLIACKPVLGRHEEHLRTTEFKFMNRYSEAEVDALLGFQKFYQTYRETNLDSASGLTSQGYEIAESVGLTKEDISKIFHMSDKIEKRRKQGANLCTGISEERIKEKRRKIRESEEFWQRFNERFRKEQKDKGDS